MPPHRQRSTHVKAKRPRKSFNTKAWLECELVRTRARDLVGPGRVGQQAAGGRVNLDVLAQHHTQALHVATLRLRASPATSLSVSITLLSCCALFVERGMHAVALHHGHACTDARQEQAEWTAFNQRRPMPLLLNMNRARPLPRPILKQTLSTACGLAGPIAAPGRCPQRDSGSARRRS